MKLAKQAGLRKRAKEAPEVVNNDFGGDVGLGGVADQTRGQDATGIDFTTQSTSVSHEQSCGNIMDRPAVFENPQCLAT